MATVTSLRFNISAQYLDRKAFERVRHDIRRTAEDQSFLTESTRRATRAMMSFGPAVMPVLAAASKGATEVAASFSAAAIGIGLFAMAAKSQLGDTFSTFKRVQQLNQIMKENAKGSEAWEKAAEKKKLLLAQLDPLERKAYNNMLDVQKAWKGFGKSVRPELFDTLGIAMETAILAMEKFEPALKPIAQVVKGIAYEIRNWVAGPGFTKFVKWVKDNAAYAINALWISVKNVGSGLITLASRMGALDTKPFNDWLTRTTAKFKQWSNSEGARKLIDFIKQSAPVVGNFVKAILNLVVQITKAIGPIGIEVLKALTPILNWMAGFINKYPIVVQGLWALYAALKALAFAKIVALNLKLFGSALAWVATNLTRVNRMGPLKVNLLQLQGLSAGASAATEAFAGSLGRASTKSNGLKGGLAGLLTKLGPAKAGLVGLALVGVGLLIAGFVKAYRENRVLNDKVNRLKNAVKPLAGILVKVAEFGFQVFIDICILAVTWISNFLSNVVWLTVKAVQLAGKMGIVSDAVEATVVKFGNDWNKAMATAATDTNNTRKKVDQLKTSLSALQGQVSQGQAWVAYRQQHADTQKMLKKTKGNTDANTQAGRDLRNQLYSEVEAGLAWYNSLNKQQRQGKNTKNELKRLRDMVKDVGKGEDWAKGMVQNLNKALRNTPKNVKAKVNVYGNGSWKLPKSHSGTKKQVAKIARHLGGTFATGGAVAGKGTGTSDSIPARLSHGEHVLTAKEVKSAGGHGNIYAWRKQLQASSAPKKFAKGGAVGVKTHSGGRVSSNLEAVRSGFIKGYSNHAGKGIDREGSEMATQWRQLLMQLLNAGGWMLPKGNLKKAVRWAKTQHGKEYQWGGNGNPSWDCSGYLSAIESVIRGESPHRRWATMAFRGKQAPPGWKLNGDSPFGIGITNRGVGHAAGTLMGTNVEASGSGDVRYGGGARGSNHKMFSQRYGFMPARKMAVPSIGGSYKKGTVPAGQRRRLLTQAMRLAGFAPNAAAINRWMQLVQNESGWNTAAYNGWDINAKNGVASRGLAQIIPPTFRAHARGGWSINNPVHNVAAAMRYARSRYGSLAGTPLGGYMNGVKNAPKGPALVGEGGPELLNFKGGESVTNNRDTAKALGGGDTIEINFNDKVYVKSEKEFKKMVLDALDDAKRKPSY